MELHDVETVKLAAADRREALRRSMGRPPERRVRRRIGRTLVALGERIGDGEQLPEPVRRYA